MGISTVVKANYKWSSEGARNRKVGMVAQLVVQSEFLSLECCLSHAAVPPAIVDAKSPDQKDFINWGHKKEDLQPTGADGFWVNRLYCILYPIMKLIPVSTMFSFKAFWIQCYGFVAEGSNNYRWMRTNRFLALTCARERIVRCCRSSPSSPSRPEPSSHSTMPSSHHSHRTGCL